MMNVSYEVEVSKPDHLEVLRGTLTEWSRLDHDVLLISAEGLKVSTSKVLLSLYSEHLRSILTQQPLLLSPSPAVISTPASASTISALLELLATGRAASRALPETTCLASDLGINISNCFLENRKTFVKKPESQPSKLIKPKMINPTKTTTLNISNIKQNTDTKPDKKAEGVTKNNLCCDVCGKPFKENKYLYSHRYRKHGLKKKEKPPVEIGSSAGLLTSIHWTTCDVCGKVFMESKYLARHKLKDHGLKSKNQPPEQIIKKTKTENYFCDICKTNWDTPTDLRKHMLIHLPETERPHNLGAANEEVSVSQEELGSFRETETLSEVAVAEEVESNVLLPGDPFAEFCDLIIETEDNTGGHDNCGYCGADFEDENELNQHIFNHHG